MGEGKGEGEERWVLWVKVKVKKDACYGYGER